MKKTFLLIFIISFSFGLRSQTVELRYCSSTIYMSTGGKKGFAFVINENFIIDSIPLSSDTLSNYFSLEFSRKNKLRYITKDNELFSPHKDFGIDTSLFVILVDTKKMLVVNGEIHSKDAELQRVHNFSVVKMCMCRDLKKYGWWRGRNGFISIETKE